MGSRAVAAAFSAVLEAKENNFCSIDGSFPDQIRLLCQFSA